MKIIQIGENFDNEYFSSVNYLSDYYFLDADIIIIDLDAIRREFANLFHSHGAGKFYIPEKKYSDFCLKAKTRTDELKKYLASKGNIFVDIGETTKFDFTVINLDSTTFTANIDFWNLIHLNSDDFVLENKTGENLSYPVEIFEAFFLSFDGTYNFIFDRFKGFPIANVKNTKQAVSICVPENKGCIILLPELKLNADSQSEYEYRSSEARNAFLILDERLKVLNPSLDEALPVWCESLQIGNEKMELEKLDELKETAKVISSKIHDQLVVLDEFRKLKILISGSGNSLEKIVEFVFAEFGYNILEREHNRDDLIISYSESIAVIEIKGVKGSAGETHAAQLMKWVNTYHLENKRLPKGILIVNAFKDKPLSERTEQVFPNQMMKFSNQMEFCLLTTEQLLSLYLEFKDGQKSFSELNNLLFTTVGRLNYNSKLTL